GRILQPITGFRTGLIEGPDLLTRYSRPVSFGIRRCEFDHYLLGRTGARLRLGTPLTSLRADGDRFIVNDEIAAPLVVGAGGHFCPVARLMTSGTRDSEVVVLAQEIEFEMTADQRCECRVEEQVPELFFCEDLKGYGWCFRKGNFLNVGLGREGEARLSAHVDQFIDRLVSRGRIPYGLTKRFHGHAYRLYLGPPRTPTDDRVLLIGDAAGLAYPQSGEGIRPAIESGLLAAATILETPRQYWNQLASRLQRKMLERFGRRGSAGGSARLIPHSWRRFAARRLLSSPWFSRRVLIERWFLHMDQPALDPASIAPAMAMAE
ncbi:MAG TPA: NAD(P)/FAD-dependent oxidoreductase, partial [Planctomycetaceae bacterium]|nr:NAD(P)/FAD-dependent oxidoreductase [Planctomycetaceae bacterium]